MELALGGGSSVSAAAFAQVSYPIGLTSLADLFSHLEYCEFSSTTNGSFSVMEPWSMTQSKNMIKAAVAVC